MTAFLIFLITAAIAFLFVAPYQAHLTLEASIRIKDETILSTSNQLKFHIEYVEYLQKNPRYGAEGDHPKKFRGFADDCFDNGNYASVVLAVEKLYAEPKTELNANFQQVLCEPTYFGALLKARIEQKNISRTEKSEAVYKFQASLSSMTNRINEAVLNKNPKDNYNSRIYLGCNKASLQKLLAVSPDETTNFVSQIIQTVGSLQKRATNP